MDKTPSWAEGLCGRLRSHVSLAKRCWFGVGGPAEWLYTAEDETDLSTFMQQRPKDLPLHMLGVGSNLLVRDGGLPGITLRLGRGFNRIEALEEQQLYAGAACMDVHVATFACEHSLTELEFLSGIPGTIGGALAMNAGAYGREMKDILIEAHLIDADGQSLRMSPQELQYSYRHATPPKDAIFTGAILQGKEGDQAIIAATMQKISEERGLTQPVKSRTGGSTFKNPEGHKAWKLIDEAGCRGLTIGDAQVSEQHCNFLINKGNATAHDLETLGNTVKTRVKQTSGIDLEWEIKRIGNL